MITPGTKDLGRKVLCRKYDDPQTGHWVEGRLRGIQKMRVVVEFADMSVEINRADLEWATA